MSNSWDTLGTLATAISLLLLGAILKALEWIGVGFFIAVGFAIFLLLIR